MTLKKTTTTPFTIAYSNKERTQSYEKLKTKKKFKTRKKEVQRRGRKIRNKKKLKCQGKEKCIDIFSVRSITDKLVVFSPKSHNDKR
jgi:hypothetical protein